MKLKSEKIFHEKFFFSLIFNENLMEKILRDEFFDFSRVFSPGDCNFFIFQQKSHAQNFQAQSSIMKGVMIFAKLVLILANQNAQITNFAFGKLVSTKRLSR